MSQGGTMGVLNSHSTGLIKVYLPSLDEQKSIASALKTWDTAIEKTEALIDAKERQFGWLVMILMDKYFKSYRKPFIFVC